MLIYYTLCEYLSRTLDVPRGDRCSSEIRRTGEEMVASSKTLKKHSTNKCEFGFIVDFVLEFYCVMKCTVLEGVSWFSWK